MQEHIQRLREIKHFASFRRRRKKIAKEHARGKLTAAQRINLLLDPGGFHEFNMLIKHKIGAPGDGIVIGHGTIDGRTVCVFSQDVTVFGGSQGIIMGESCIRSMKWPWIWACALIGLNDSPGRWLSGLSLPVAMTPTGSVMKSLPGWCFI